MQAANAGAKEGTTGPGRGELGAGAEEAGRRLSTHIRHHHHGTIAADTHRAQTPTQTRSVPWRCGAPTHSLRPLQRSLAARTGAAPCFLLSPQAQGRRRRRRLRRGDCAAPAVVIDAPCTFSDLLHCVYNAGISVCDSVVMPHGTNCRSACVARSDLRFCYKINPVGREACAWRWCAEKLRMRTNSRRMNTTVRTNARWFFGGDARNSNSNGNAKARLERSESANEDILIFYFQLDVQTRIQYALNIEQFDAAKQLREKLAEMETEINRQREAKRGSSKNEAQDKALNLLRARADLQKAIESENYALAAELRDTIAKLEGDSLALSAKALAYQSVKYEFRLGQKVRHKVHGYRAVICGMDPVCCESKSWMETANVEKLSKGPNQPFYQVLVDVYADPELLVAYVADENLSEADESEKGRFEHPYTEFLFYGEDMARDFIPVKQLREKYDQPRYEASGDENDDDGTSNS